ncbi:MAG: DUF3299 domain-containing protein [Pseudomonadota bacterium]
MLTRLFASLVLILFANVAVANDTPRQIGWEDLLPQLDPIKNPFDAMSLEVREDLGFIFRVKADLELGLIDEDGPEMQEVYKVSERVEEAGVDIDALEDHLDELQAELNRRDGMVNRDLEGDIVRLPGYALPLELTEGGVTEFLLVPYVGACIHSPAPPPNQMVFVKLREEYEVKSLYDPVWITGQLRVEQASRSLTFVDGTNDVATGYALSGVTIEPYE